MFSTTSLKTLVIFCLFPETNLTRMFNLEATFSPDVCLNVTTTDLLWLLCSPHLDDAHVLVKLGLDHLLDLTVELHEAHVADVAQHQHDALPPQDHVVQEEDDEHDKVQDVEGHVSEQGPPGEVQHLPGENGTHANHKQDVEDS